AGHGAEPDGGAHPGHRCRPDDPLHVPHQRDAHGARLVSDLADLPGEVHQRGDPRPRGLRRRHRRRLQSGPWRRRRRPHPGGSRQSRGGLCVRAVPDGGAARGTRGGDPVPAARSARSRGGAVGLMRLTTWLSLAVAGAAVIALLLGPEFLRPSSLYLVSLWAVTAIAAMGL